MIGIIGAMVTEIDYLTSLLEDAHTDTVSGIEYRSGKMHGKEVVIAKCGVGKVYAAVCTQTMILRYRPDVIINTGTGGTLSKSLGICDICIAERVLQHDMDTSAVGDPVGMVSGVNRIYFPCDKAIAEKIAEIAGAIGAHSVIGTIASGDQFVADAERKKQIVSLFAADACEMEAGAIGHVCFINNVPFAAIRAISDNADGDSTMDYAVFVGKAAKISAGIVEEYVKQA